jgi:hypothetical protein
MIKSRKPMKKSKSRKHVGYTIKKNRIVKVYCKPDKKTGKISKSCPKKQRVFSNNKSASRSRLYKKKSTVNKVLKSKTPVKKSKSRKSKRKFRIGKKPTIAQMRAECKKKGLVYDTKTKKCRESKRGKPKKVKSPKKEKKVSHKNASELGYGVSWASHIRKLEKSQYGKSTEEIKQIKKQIDDITCKFATTPLLSENEIDKIKRKKGMSNWKIFNFFEEDWWEGPKANAEQVKEYARKAGLKVQERSKIKVTL